MNPKGEGVSNVMKMSDKCSTNEIARLQEKIVSLFKTVRELKTSVSSITTSPPVVDCSSTFRYPSLEQLSSLTLLIDRSSAHCRCSTTPLLKKQKDKAPPNDRQITKGFVAIIEPTAIELASVRTCVSGRLASLEPCIK